VGQEATKTHGAMAAAQVMEAAAATANEMETMELVVSKDDEET
jgi:hypothetical protein